MHSERKSPSGLQPQTSLLAITGQKLLAAAISNFRSHTAFCETRHLKTHTIDIHC